MFQASHLSTPMGVDREDASSGASFASGPRGSLRRAPPSYGPRISRGEICPDFSHCNPSGSSGTFAKRRI
eukprot:3607767-Pyramimonas_sp.AAC.1